MAACYSFCNLIVKFVTWKKKYYTPDIYKSIKCTSQKWLTIHLQWMWSTSRIIGMLVYILGKVITSSNLQNLFDSSKIL